MLADPVVSAPSVERAFDEQNGPHVQGDFALQPNLRLRLLGAPKTHPGRLLAILHGSSSNEAALQCQALTILVNAVPVQPITQVATSKAPRIHIEGSFEAAAFQPLAQRFPTFALRACEKVWKFSEAQLVELQKFVAIYVDLNAAPAAEAPPATDGSP